LDFIRYVLVNQMQRGLNSNGCPDSYREVNGLEKVQDNPDWGMVLFHLNRILIKESWLEKVIQPIRKPETSLKSYMMI